MPTTRRRTGGWIAGGLLAAAIGVAVGVGLAPPRDHDLVPVSVRIPAGSAARALLGGLAEGERLVGWTVEAIEGPIDGQLRVFVGREGVRFALMVEPKAGTDKRAPVQTERYAIFYGHADPEDTQLPANTIKATTNALARRIRAHEGDVTVPGL